MDLNISVEPARDEALTGSVDDVKLIPATKVSKRKRWKKPKDKPKRPLSAYNLFFQHERERLLYGDCEPLEGATNTTDETTAVDLEKKGDGRIGFAALAKEVASKWKLLEPHQKESFEKEAEKEKERYKVELDEWKKNQIKREREAEEWVTRHDDVIRSLSAVSSENERTELGLQSAISMQPRFSATGSLPPGYLERSINDAFFNDIHSQQISQYEQLLLNESLNQQRRLDRERALSLALGNFSQESGLRSLNESPMDFYTRMIYSGTSDVVAANAMHDYLSAQYAAAGMSLGVSNVGFPGQNQRLPLNSVLSDALLSTQLHPPARRNDGLLQSLDVPFASYPGTERAEEQQGLLLQQLREHQEEDDDSSIQFMNNLRRRR